MLAASSSRHDPQRTWGQSRRAHSLFDYGFEAVGFAVVPLMAEDKVMPHSIFALLPARH
jgi:hypothetical protein